MKTFHFIYSVMKSDRKRKDCVQPGLFWYIIFGEKHFAKQEDNQCLSESVQPVGQMKQWSKKTGWGMTQKSSKQLAQDVVPLLNMFSNQINFTVLSDALPNFFKPFCSMCFINLQDSFGLSKHICCHCNSLKTFLFVTLSQVQISSYSHPMKCYMLIHSLIVMLSKFSIRALANET